MVRATAPKGLTEVKSKVPPGLTKWQLACLPPAVFMGVLPFFLLKGSTGTSAVSFCMMFVILPFFLLGMYEWNGEPLEVITKHFIRTKFLLPKECPH